MGAAGTHAPGHDKIAALYPDPASGLIKELQVAAIAVRENRPYRIWIQSLLGRAQALTDRIVDDAALVDVREAIGDVFSLCTSE